MNSKYNKQNNIKEAIMEVVAFFDLFDYPLTGLELRRYLSVKCGLINIEKALESKIFLEAIEEKNGFYFLRGRKEIIKTKMARYNYADKKFKKAMLVSRFFKIIPWIKMIAAGNLIGSHNLKKQGDIDLFIITKKNRVWMTRFFCAGFARLFGLRPTEKNTRDKICLSFFVSEDAMDLQGLMLSNRSSESLSPQEAGQAGDSDEAEGKASFYRALARVPAALAANLSEAKASTPDLKVGRSNLGTVWQKLKIHDIYFIYWLAGLVPIYNKDDAYNEFIKANGWLKNYLPNWRPAKMSFRRDSGQGFSRFYEDVIDLLIGGAEKAVKKIQLKKMPEKLKISMNKDTRVVVNDDVLKLYTNDRREEYRKRWKEKLAEIEMAGWILK